jgi:aspartate/methionine/tyrosine aminotransferase
MALKVSDRGNIPAFYVMDVMRAARERAAAVGDVLHLEVGQPSTGAPARALAAAKAALDGDKLGYTLALGLEELRARIARHYADDYGVTVDPEQVVITPGSSGGFILSFLSAFNPGDKVGLACPGYPCYRNILSAFGVEPVLIPVGAGSRFQPTVAVLEQLGLDLDGLIVASPSNPTGSMLPPEDFHALADYCTRRGIRLVSDEIYHGITYGIRAETAAGPNSTAIVVNSFSKNIAGFCRLCR